MSVPFLDRSLLAAALAGSADALSACAAADPDGQASDRERATPALAIAARAAGLEAPAGWRRARRRGVAAWMALEADLESTARCLDAVGIAWAPLKGIDLATRVEARPVYPQPEARPTGDLDLLIPRGALTPARQALEAAGWRPLAPGPRSLRYLHDEGYAWQAWAPGGALVELHWRLWGSVPERFANRLFARTAADGELPPGGRRLDRADAWLLAAHHLFLDPGPRPVGRLLDLVRLVDSVAAGPGPDHGPTFAERIARAAIESDLQLSALLAAREATALWPRAHLDRLIALLTPALRGPERWLDRRAQRGQASTPGALLAARLLAGRDSRRGWAALPRRIWPHPGLVERATPDTLSWPRRRALYQWRRLRGR